jgi:hypothetical protein
MSTQGLLWGKDVCAVQTGASPPGCMSCRVLAAAHGLQAQHEGEYNKCYQEICVGNVHKDLSASSVARICALAVVYGLVSQAGNAVRICVLVVVPKTCVLAGVHAAGLKQATLMPMATCVKHRVGSG